MGDIEVARPHLDLQGRVPLADVVAVAHGGHHDHPQRDQDRPMRDRLTPYEHHQRRSHQQRVEHQRRHQRPKSLEVCIRAGQVHRDHVAGNRHQPHANQGVAVELPVLPGAAQQLTTQQDDRCQQDSIDAAHPVPSHQLDTDVDTNVADRPTQQRADSADGEIVLPVGGEAGYDQREHQQMAEQIKALGLVGEIARPVRTEQQEGRPAQHRETVVHGLHAEAQWHACVCVPQSIGRNEDRQAVGADQPPVDWRGSLLLNLRPQTQTDDATAEQIADAERELRTASRAEVDAQVEQQVTTDREKNIDHNSLRIVALP